MCVQTARSWRRGFVTDGSTLVVGVGSLVRGDDGVGHVVAERIEALGLPGVSVLAVTQLVPELAESMSDARLVVFVDADVHADRPVVRSVAAAGPGPVSHHGTAESLCRLVELMGGPCPPTRVVGMPAGQFEVGEGPTAECLRHVDDAVRLISDLARSGGDFPLPGGPESG